METNREVLVRALRNLVSEIYSDCKGAYGGADYEGQFESAIQKVADAVYPTQANEDH